MSPGTDNRIKFIAYLQVIAIILVVLYHSFHEHPGGNFGYDLWGMRLLATMRMPIFLFISGFLLIITTNRKNPGWTEFTRNKLKRLLIPFLALSLITFVPRALMSGMADDTIELSFRSLLYSLFRSDSMVIPFFWYLQASIILLTVTYGLTLLFRKVGIAPIYLYLGILFTLIAARIFGLAQTPWFSIGKIVMWGSNFFLGVLYANIPESIDRKIPWTSPFFMLTSAAVWILLFIFLEDIRPLDQLTNIAAFVTFISLAKILEARNITVIDPLVGANYIIFLLSWYFNIASQQVLHHFVPSIPWQVNTILSLFLGIFCPLAIYNYMKRHKSARAVRITAFLLGQRI